MIEERELHSRLAEFRDAARLWSETAPIPAQPARRRAWKLFVLAPLAACALLLLLVPRHAPPAPATLARDNQLLAQINGEVEASVPTPLAPLQVNSQ